MALERKILQILPADGWYAVFTNTGGDDAFDPLVCFALVEDRHPPSAPSMIQAVVPMSWQDGYVDFCDSTKNFSHITRELAEGVAPK